MQKIDRLAPFDSNGVTRLWVEREQPLKDYLRDLLMPIYHYGCSDASGQAHA